MPLSAAAFLSQIARTPMAGLALSTLASLGRTGFVSLYSAMRAAEILSAELGDDASTFVTDVSLDEHGQHGRLACDLRYAEYRHLFFTPRFSLNDRSALRFIASRARKVDAVFDVGSSAGRFAYAAAAAGARRVYAFEPIPRLAALLRANSAHNPWGAAIRIHEELVGGEDGGTAPFFVVWPDTESTMVPQRASARELRQELRLPVVRLDRFCEREGLDPRLVVFKIDVNGTEMATLAGLGGVLDLPDAPDIVVELLAQSLQQGAIEQLCARGYQVYYLLPWGPVRVETGPGWFPHQDLACWDFLLTKRDLPI